MAIIVVSGSGRGVGKTGLVCGLIAALPELRWTAVKVTSHAHGDLPAIYDEKLAGQGTDTARYLAAGAARAFLVTASDAELAGRVQEIQSVLVLGANVIFESNRIVRHLRPDLCLAVCAGAEADGAKPSFAHPRQLADAIVEASETDRFLEDVSADGQRPMPVFHLRRFERVSPEMRSWLRRRLAARDENPAVWA